MKTAAIHTLSRTLDMLVLADGSAYFIRHDRVFRLSASERRNLERALGQRRDPAQSPFPDTPGMQEIQGNRDRPDGGR